MVEGTGIEVEYDESPVAYDARAVETMATQLIGEGGWCKGSVLELEGGLRWRPTLVSEDRSAIAHLHFASELRSYVVDRIKACGKAGLVVHIVLPLAALYDAEVIDVLAEVDAMVHVAERGLAHSAHHLDAISRSGVPLAPASRRRVAMANWARMRAGSNSQKGKRFEAFLAFLLEQTPDLAVVERNYRGDTDEIDLVVQVVRYVGRCWFQEGVPFILVEAKNRTEPTSQGMVSHLIRRLQTKRGTARIGLLFTTSKFTKDAELEIVKLAEGQITVVLIRPADIERWMSADDPHEFIEGLVRKAMLR